MRTILSVLNAWAGAFKTAICEAGDFYSRLFTNKLGLPRWLWLVTMASLALALIVLIVGASQ